MTNGGLLGNVDFLPTLLDLIGESLPDNLDGRSFAGAFRSGDAPPRERISGMFGGAGNRFVRTSRHKLNPELQATAAVCDAR
jgi:arylsulfatase A-like enzyme